MTSIERKINGMRQLPQSVFIKAWSEENPLKLWVLSIFICR
jgi:hypothetical protein